MKIVAIIPIKSNSTRVKRKNFIKVHNGKPLYKYFLDKIKKCNFDEIYVDSDSKEIMNFCNKNKINFMMSIKTINKCINFLKLNNKFDSIFTCHKIYSWFWFNKKPVNYKPEILPRSQDAKPIVMETTGLYGIRNKTLKKYKCRIGKKPYFFEVTKKEALDLDTKEDFKILKSYLKN